MTDWVSLSLAVRYRFVAKHRFRRLLRWAIPLALAAALLSGLDHLARQAATRWALSEVRTAAEAVAALRVALLRNEIEKQRTLPIILAQDPDVRTALLTKDPQRLAALNVKLDTLSTGTRTAVIYLLDPEGLTIAASNWQTPTSFIGNNYSFRSYYRDAMAHGAAERFALGTVSQRPGLFLTRRIDGPAGVLGIIVVKAEFEAIETQWHRFAEPTFATDERSIVLVTSEPAWRFRATTLISPEQRADIRASLQFGDAPLDPLPIVPSGSDQDVVRARLPRDVIDQSFVELAAPVETTHWTLHVLAPTAGAVDLAATTARLLALLVGAIGIGATGLWFSRRRRLAAERAQQHAMRQDLEGRVRIRTAELEDANGRLVAEIDERRRAQAALHDLQDELVQASKLAVLGQIGAGVAHEINQPVAAIRTFAENCDALIARNDLVAVRSNLALISSLTEKIGTITDELRAFARKAPRRIEQVSIRAAIDGALLLVGHRLRQQGVDLAIEMAEADFVVAADRVRLEQVLVNLLQNALEALVGRPDGRIEIRATCEPDRAVIKIVDNGPGLPPAVMHSLFMPFTTTKPTGLGLGLVISHDIIAELAGSFAAENGDCGAVFTITLPRPS